MSRWKYLTALVTAGDNCQHVRQLTTGERAAFAADSKKQKAGEITGSQMAENLAAMACINPQMTAEEVKEMPPELLDACVAKICELSGLKGKGEPPESAAEGGAEGEKKAEATAGLNS